MEGGSVSADRFTLAVDEAHRVLRRSAGMTSVLDLMSREVRHLGGPMLFTGKFRASFPAPATVLINKRDMSYPLYSFKWLK